MLQLMKLGRSGCLQRKKWRQMSSTLLLIISFLYIGYLIINPKHSWVQPETFVYKHYIMQHAMSIQSVIKDTFNTWVFEGENRITRPLSTTFEIIDTHFRAWLWQFMTPMPSLSLSFIFSIFLASYLFYHLLRNWGIRPMIAQFATAFMLLSPGTLSLVTMLFRPAKPLMNFWIIFCLYLASIIHKQDTVSATNRKTFLLVCLLWLSVFTAFLFDETALIISIVIAFFFPSAILKNYQRMFAFSLIPIILLILYFFVFPRITAAYGFGKVSLLDYGILSKSHFPKLHVFWKNVKMNTYLLFSENLGLYNPRQMPNFWKKAIFAISSVFTIGFLIYSLVRITIFNFSRAQYLSLLYKSLFCIVVLCFVDSILLDIVSNGPLGRIWGSYWYGCYLGIFFAIFIAVLGEEIVELRVGAKAFVAMIWLIALVFIISFPYTNYVYRSFHFYPYRSGDIEAMYRGNVNRFMIYDSHVFANRAELAEVWRMSSHQVLPKEIKKEFYWVLVEKGLLANFPMPNLSDVCTDKPGHTYIIPLRS